jgi:hypothetical protein
MKSGKIFISSLVEKRDKTKVCLLFRENFPTRSTLTKEKGTKTTSTHQAPGHYYYYYQTL